MTTARFAIVLLTFACFASTAFGQGADVIVGALPSMENYEMSGDIDSFAVATTSCNIGDETLTWFAATNEHPVIAQNVYRLKDGRFEQIGMSWLKHGFFAVQGTLCEDDPANPLCDPNPTGAALGVGCSDPYGAALNGEQGGLGPRWEVNPTTGEFPFPFDAPPFAGTIARRIQIHVDDIDPDLNEFAEYYVEGQYIHPDDAAAGNDLNNCSYAQMAFTGIDDYLGVVTGFTQRMVPAIEAWQVADPEVNLENLDVPSDGRFVIGTLVSENSDGTWHYEYAVFNMNSERAGGSFSVPLPIDCTVTNIEFHGVPYHSGEPFDNLPWNFEVTAGAITWSVDGTFPVGEPRENDTANALRWGTLYNFRFDCDAAPIEDDITLGLYKPDDVEDDSFTVPSQRPEGTTLDVTFANAGCTWTGSVVHLDWFNEDTEYTGIEIFRDGELLATLEGDATSYSVEDAEEGPQVYTIVASIDDTPIAGTRCTVVVPAAPEAGFRMIARNASGEVNLAGVGSVTATVALDEDDAHAGYPNTVTGLSVALGHDALVLESTGATLLPALTDLNDGEGPDYFASQSWEDGTTVGLLLDFELVDTLLFEEEIDLFEVSYDTVAETLITLPHGVSTTLEWVDARGTPPVETYIQGSDSVFTPNRQHAVIDFTVDASALPEFRRGDANGNGTISAILDALFLLEWGFAGGDIPPCDDAADANDNGVVSAILDALFLLEWGFNAGEAIPDPGPDSCGPDPTADALDCATTPTC